MRYPKPIDMDDGLTKASVRATGMLSVQYVAPGGMAPSFDGLSMGGGNHVPTWNPRQSSI